jgi:hypothetical protein
MEPRMFRLRHLDQVAWMVVELVLVVVVDDHAGTRRPAVGEGKNA